MFDSVYIVRKLNDPTNQRVNFVHDTMIRVAERAGLFVYLNAERCNDRTLIVALGGDGTMLHAMRLSANTGSTAMGINLGNVGFLTDFTALDASYLEETLRDVLEYQGQLFNIEERVMIRGSIVGHVQDIIAGNEFAISRSTSDSMIQYRLTVNGYDAGVHRANSIVVSSPTGSTAYSLSAGGALLMPSMRAMQVVPIAPMTLTSRPLIAESTSNITISAWGGEMSVRADGVSQGVPVREYTASDPLIVTLSGSPYPARVLHTESWSFFDVLTTKLGWIRG